MVAAEMCIRDRISNDEVRVRVIHAGVGAISKSDVDLADASNAIIIGFNVRPDNVAKEEAAATKVEMRMYRVIYDAINDVTDAMKGMLAPKFREVSLGELQVRQVYKISNVGTVAGCRVTSGKITRDSKVRVVRDGIVIAEDEIASLKRFLSLIHILRIRLCGKAAPARAKRAWCSCPTSPRRKCSLRPTRTG